MRIAALLLPALVACATPADNPDTGTQGCSGGKCDGEEVWLYKAGQTPWVSCTGAGNRVTCNLAPAPQGVRPTQVMMNKGDVPFFYPTSLTAAAPSFQLPDTFTSSDQITLAARAPNSGLGDLRKVVRAPAAGATTTFFMPYDVWRITVTNVDAAAGSLILKYAVEITDAQFMIAQGGRKVDFFGSLGVSPGENGASKSTTYYVPVTAGGKVGAYYTASGISGPPQLTLEKPGCYLMQGESPALVTYDENCTRTRELVAPSPTEPTPTEPTPDAPTEPTPPAEICVAGTQHECDDAGETWNGTQCCYAGPVECVAGTQYECDDAGESWSGSQCCLTGEAQCLAGTQYECDDAGEHWTGSTCCVAETAYCVTGTQYECDDSGESWTGSQCCLANPTQCVPGTQYECDDTGESWTGTQCCVAPALTCTAGSQSSCSGGTWTGSQCCR